MYPNPKRARNFTQVFLKQSMIIFLLKVWQELKDQILNPVWHVHKGITREKIIMPFSMLLNLVGSSNVNKDILWKFM